VFSVSEHWLHSYDLFALSNVHPEFHVWGLASPNEEDLTNCAPCRSGDFLA